MGGVARTRRWVMGEWSALMEFFVSLYRRLCGSRRGRFLLVLLVSLVLLAGASFLYTRGEGGAGIPCPTYFFAGLYCAGCGASRALRSILHLNFYQAFRYNPLLVLLLPLIGLYFAAVAASFVRTGQNRVDARLSFRWLYVLAVVVLLYSIVRNLPFFPFVLLRPTIV